MLRYEADPSNFNFKSVRKKRKRKLLTWLFMFNRLQKKGISLEVHDRIRKKGENQQLVNGLPLDDFNELDKRVLPSSHT